MYRYRPLRDPAIEIRLLLWHTRSNNPRNDRLAFSVKHVPIYESPPYIAICSSRRKDPATDTIVLDDREFEITSTTYNALRALCSLFLTTQDTCRDVGTTSIEVLRIWIAAVCINQHDIWERQQQVKMMRTIYSSASAVFHYSQSINDIFNYTGTINKETDPFLRHYTLKRHYIVLRYSPLLEYWSLSDMTIFDVTDVTPRDMQIALLGLLTDASNYGRLRSDRTLSDGDDHEKGVRAPSRNQIGPPVYEADRRWLRLLITIALLAMHDPDYRSLKEASISKDEANNRTSKTTLTVSHPCFARAWIFQEALLGIRPIMVSPMCLKSQRVDSALLHLSNNKGYTWQNRTDEKEVSPVWHSTNVHGLDVVHFDLLPASMFIVNQEKPSELWLPQEAVDVQLGRCSEGVTNSERQTELDNFKPIILLLDNGSPPSWKPAEAMQDERVPDYSTAFECTSTDPRPTETVKEGLQDVVPTSLSAQLASDEEEQVSESDLNAEDGTTSTISSCTSSHSPDAMPGSRAEVLYRRLVPLLEELDYVGDDEEDLSVLPSASFANVDRRVSLTVDKLQSLEAAKLHHRVEQYNIHSPVISIAQGSSNKEYLSAANSPLQDGSKQTKSATSKTSSSSSRQRSDQPTKQSNKRLPNRLRSEQGDSDDDPPEKCRKPLEEDFVDSTQEAYNVIPCIDHGCPGQNGTIREWIEKIATHHRRYICKTCWNEVDRAHYQCESKTRACELRCLCRKGSALVTAGDPVVPHMRSGSCQRPAPGPDELIYKHLCNLLKVNPRPFGFGHREYHNGERSRKRQRKVNEVQMNQVKMNEVRALLPDLKREYQLKVETLETHNRGLKRLLRQFHMTMTGAGLTIDDSLLEGVLEYAPDILKPVYRGNASCPTWHTNSSVNNNDLFPGPAVHTPDNETSFEGRGRNCSSSNGHLQERDVNPAYGMQWTGNTSNSVIRSRGYINRETDGGNAAPASNAFIHEDTATSNLVDEDLDQFIDLWSR